MSDKNKVLFQLQEIFEENEEQENTLHAVQERQGDRRGDQKPYVGANKRTHIERRMAEDMRKKDEVVCDQEQEIQRLRDRNAKLEADANPPLIECIVYYSALGFSVLIVAVWGGIVSFL